MARVAGHGWTRGAGQGSGWASGAVGWPAGRYRGPVGALPAGRRGREAGRCRLGRISGPSGGGPGGADRPLVWDGPAALVPVLVGVGVAGTGRPGPRPGISAGGCSWPGSRCGRTGASGASRGPARRSRWRVRRMRRRCGRIARRCCAASMISTWRRAPARWSIRSRWIGPGGAGGLMRTAIRWSRYRNERSGLYRPTVPSRIPRSVPDEEFNEIFAALHSHRDRALVAFYVSTGARASELLSATQGGADPGRQLITVVRKGSRGAAAAAGLGRCVRVAAAVPGGDGRAGPAGRGSRCGGRCAAGPAVDLSRGAPHVRAGRAGGGHDATLHSLRYTAAYRMEGRGITQRNAAWRRAGPSSNMRCARDRPAAGTVGATSTTTAARCRGLTAGIASMHGLHGVRRCRASFGRRGARRQLFDGRSACRCRVANSCEGRDCRRSSRPSSRSSAMSVTTTIGPTPGTVRSRRSIAASSIALPLAERSPTLERVALANQFTVGRDRDRLYMIPSLSSPS